MQKTNDSLSTNRRNFLKASGTAAAAASAISFPTVTFGKPDSRKLKIGFIGCGGRGTGAAAQALNADSNVELWAMGDEFKQNVDRSLANVLKELLKRFEDAESGGEPLNKAEHEAAEQKLAEEAPNPGSDNFK